MMKYLTGMLLVILLLSSSIAQTVTLGITTKNLALVEEIRPVPVSKGLQLISLTDLPEALDPTSVRAEFNPSSIRIVEQIFTSPQPNIQTILVNSIGKSIRILHPELGTIHGNLLSFSGGTLVVQTPDNDLRIIPDYATSQFVLDSTTKAVQNLLTKPRLLWRLQSPVKKDAEVKMSYLTGGLHWTADYSAIIDESEENMSLSSLITLSNQSAKSFYQVELTLIAGDIHRIGRPAPSPLAKGNRIMEIQAEMDSPFTQTEAFEYHTYKLSDKIDLENLQEKQIPLFSPVSVQAIKSYTYNYQKDPTNVSVSYIVENTRDNNLGIPLPEGRIRIYKRERNQLLILGEDLLPNTPKGESLETEVGKVFDIKAERIVLEQKREGKNSEKMKISVDLRNQKDEDVTVIITEPLFRHRNAKILSSNHPVYKQDAGKIEFKVPVKSGKSESLIYELIYSW